VKVIRAHAYLEREPVWSGGTVVYSLIPSELSAALSLVICAGGEDREPCGTTRLLCELINAPAGGAGGGETAAGRVCATCQEGTEFVGGQMLLECVHQSQTTDHQCVVIATVSSSHDEVEETMAAVTLAAQ
jgi:hypothetical protein